MTEFAEFSAYTRWKIVRLPSSPSCTNTVNPFVLLGEVDVQYICVSPSLLTELLQKHKTCLIARESTYRKVHGIKGWVVEFHPLDHIFVDLPSIPNGDSRTGSGSIHLPGHPELPVHVRRNDVGCTFHGCR